MFAGLDVGSLVTKAVILGNGDILSYSIEDSRSNPLKSAKRALDKALNSSWIGREALSFIVGTGYGRVALDFVDKTVTELTCHARGAYFLNPNVRTLIDIGGQDSKVIKLDKDGNMSDFAMNDKCAAGTGRFLEVMAHALEIELEKLGEVSLNSSTPCLVNNTCTVFAETEVISLTASGSKKEDISAGLHQAIASRVGNMAKKLGIESEILFVGGVSKNLGMRTALEEFLGIKFTSIEQDPQIVGALGAALIGKDLFEKKEERWIA
ncbi:MAG: 2-hydroxyglutaryl-CoA dehydratase [Candidatus Stahlbacteria bacterium]|nr:2-hydroxyglutaryl-CoA dehydratase [Candidatus Stahlbacteria bacterium]